VKTTLLAWAVFAFIAPPTTPTSAPVKAPRKDTPIGLAVPTDTGDRIPVPIQIVGGNAKASALFEITPSPVWERQVGDFNYEFTGVPGAYVVTAIYGDVDANGKLTLRKLRASTVINGVAPIPPTPVPPGPTPPGPTPVPPAPVAGMIDAPGFHVLIKYDRDAFLRPAEETSVLNSEAPTSVRQYLKTACPAVDGGLGFRMYPVPAVGVAAPWKAPYERTQGDLPVMTVSKSGRGWEGSIKGWAPDKVIQKIKEVEALP
jgi:hypothetical protein